LNLPLLTVHDCRLQAPTKDVERALAGGLFWLSVPEHIRLKEAYLHLVENHRASRQAASRVGSALPKAASIEFESIDDRALPVKLAGALWATGKLLRQAAIAVGLHRKTDLIAIDSLMRESEEVRLDLRLIRIQPGRKAIEHGPLNDSTILASAVYSLDPVLQQHEGSRLQPLTPNAKALVFLPGHDLSKAANTEVAWASSAMSQVDRLARHCLVLQFAKVR
jgi:hypothetical protein